MVKGVKVMEFHRFKDYKYSLFSRPLFQLYTANVYRRFAEKICKIQFAFFFLLFLQIIPAVSAFFIGHIEKFMQLSHTTVGGFLTQI